MRHIYARFAISESGTGDGSKALAMLREDLEKIQTRTVAFEDLVEGTLIPRTTRTRKKPIDSLSQERADRPVEATNASLSDPTIYNIDGTVSRGSVREA